MKSTGIVRSIDELGRLVIPKETRKELGINPGDAVEIYVDGPLVILKKHGDDCTFCGKEAPESQFMGKKICKTCLHAIRSGLGNN